MEISSYGNSSSTVDINTFENLYPALIRVFSVIILGYIAGRLGVISTTEATGIRKFVLYPTLPAFLCRAIATLEFSKVKWMLVFVVTLSKCIVFAGVTVITLLFTRDVRKAGVYSLFTTMSNDLALGLPILKALYEETHKEFIYCVYFLALVNIVLFLTVTLLMVKFSDQRSRSTTTGICHTLYKTVISVILEPAVVASIFGVVANRIWGADHLPAALDKPLETLSHAFGAAALFYLGLSVVGKVKAQIGMIILVPLSLGFAKVIILPFIIRVLCTSFNVGGDEMQEDWSTFGFIYGTIPPAPTTVIYAAVLGGQEDLLAFGLVISTMFSAPVMFSSSKMATVKKMNSTNIEYKNLLANTRNDISFVSIAFSCWVVMILFLSRRFKTPPHNFTVCLALSQLLLCFSFLLTLSDPFIECCKTFEAFLITTFLFATHCWTVLLALTLVRVRCSPLKPYYNRLLMYVFGWGFPASCGCIVALVLQSHWKDFHLSEKEFFDFLNEKKLYLAFWVIIQFISIFVCVGSLVRLYRYDHYCKCELMRKTSGENTPLLSRRRRKNCHRCENASNCSDSEEDESMETSTTYIEDTDEMISLIRSNDLDSEHELMKQKNKLELKKYYEGEQHQIGRHVIVILCQVFIMIVCTLYCMWILVGDGGKSGIFLEVQLLVSIILSAQVLVLFVAFGFERALIIDPLLQKARRYWYGVDQVVLPQISDLSREEYHICEQFVRYHKKNCMRSLTSREVEAESSLRHSLSLNGDSYYFLGSELVDWLVAVGLVADRITAVHYGNSLLRGRVIRHSQNRYYFRDSELTYEFCPGWDSESIQRTFDKST